MEPNGAGVRHNHMFADTAAIGAAGLDLARIAAELETVAAGLPATAEPCSAAIGPVGADFLGALARALANTAHDVISLGAELHGAAGAAAESAAGYAGAEHRTSRAITGVGR